MSPDAECCQNLVSAFSGTGLCSRILGLRLCMAGGDGGGTCAGDRCGGAGGACERGACQPGGHPDSRAARRRTRRSGGYRGGGGGLIAEHETHSPSSYSTLIDACESGGFRGGGGGVVAENTAHVSLSQNSALTPVDKSLICGVTFTLQYSL